MLARYEAPPVHRKTSRERRPIAFDLILERLNLPLEKQTKEAHERRFGHGRRGFRLEIRSSIANIPSRHHRQIGMPTGRGITEDTVSGQTAVAKIRPTVSNASQTGRSGHPGHIRVPGATEDYKL